MTEYISILFYLFAAHAICDFPLQGDFLSKAKNPYNEVVPNENIWITSLSMHCIIHAAAVYLITGNMVLALIEFILHFLIDYFKCENKFGFNADQALHLLCKVVYVEIMFFAHVLKAI